MAKKNTRKQTSTNAKNDAEDAAVAAEPSQAQLELEKAKEIVEPLARANASDEEMVVKLITEGQFPFKKAGRLLQHALEDMGVRLSNKDRFAQASELLIANNFAPKDWSEVVSVCEYLETELDATSAKQALVAVKKFAKENDITLPDKPKSAGGGGSRHSGFRAQVHNYMMENATSTDAEFTAWMKTQESRQGVINYYLRLFQVARTMATKIAAAA